MSDNANNSVEIQEQFSDTLLVLDKESNTVNAVKKIGKNGELETVKPIKSNQPQFIRVDKGGDLFTNFFSNFIRQLKNPTKFNFFKVALPDAVDTATKLQRHLKKPTADGEALYNKHIISTELIRQLLDSTQKQTEILKELTKHNEQIMEQKNEQSEYRFKPEQIDWDRLAQYGITKEKLEKNNQLDVLLKGYKTNELITVSADLGSEIMKFDARLSLQQKENGDVVLAFHGVRRQPNLNLEFFGHQFTEEDRNNLKKTGNMGRVVELINPKDKEQVFPSVISVDRLTNELVAYKTEYIKIPDEIKGVQLDDVQKQTLREGKALMIDGMTSQQGNTFSGIVQFNADKRYVEFVRNTNYQNQFNIQQNGSSQKVAEVPRVFRGKELTEEQFNGLKNGETVFIDNLVSQKGSTYDGYISYDPKEQQIKFQFPKEYKEKSQSAGNGETRAAGDSVQNANQKIKEANESINTGQQHETKQQDLPLEKRTNRGRKI